jgi:hypothetical protein
MANSNRLIGLAFSAGRGAQHPKSLWATHHVEASPKVGGDTTIAGPSDEFLELAMANTLAPLAAKLKFVA